MSQDNDDSSPLPLDEQRKAPIVHGSFGSDACGLPYPSESKKEHGFMTSYQQDRVSKSIWRWTEPKGSGPSNNKMNPRIKVAITTPISLLIAFALYRWRGHVVLPMAVVAIALTIGFCGLFVPPAFAAIDRFFLRFAQRIATVLTWFFLTPLFYLVFVPMRLGLKLKGSDPMERECPTEEPSYWRSRPRITRKNYYQSQH